MAANPNPVRTNRRSFLRRLALASGIATIGPLVAACGSPASTPTARPQPTKAPEPTAVPKPTATVAPAISPTASAKPTVVAKPVSSLAEDQVFRVNLMSEPSTLDASLAVSSAESTVLTQLYANLVRYKPDLNPEPDVAESWTLSPDARIYTFKLKDTRWSDGKPLTAEDFEYAFKRLLDPKVASPYASFAYEIKGAEAYNTALGTKEKPKTLGDDQLAKLRDAVGVKALDARTLQIELTTPASYFLSLLAQPSFAPLRQDVVEQSGDRYTDPSKLISNGPFVLAGWTPKTRMVLKRNPSYWDKAPTLERIELTFSAEESAVFDAYRQDRLDVSFNLPDAQIPSIRQDPLLSEDIVEGTRLATYYIGFNVKAKPFDNKLVRQAFQMAIDTRTLCEKVLLGVPRPAKSFIPPGMPGYQPELGFDFDPKRAKALLAEAGYADPKAFPKVTLVYATNPNHKIQMEYVQAQIKQNLGIQLTIENWEPQTYFRQVATDHPLMYRASWNSNYPHPDDWLRVVWATGSGLNYSQWSNKQFDDISWQAAGEVDQQKRAELYAQAQRILIDEAPAAWIYYYGIFQLVKPWIKGLITTPQDPSPGALFWRNVQILAH